VARSPACHDHRLDPSILDRARGARRGASRNPSKRSRQSDAPLADRRFVHRRCWGDILVQPALGARQHDPSAQRHACAVFPPHRQRLIRPLHALKSSLGSFRLASLPRCAARKSLADPHESVISRTSDFGTLAPGLKPGRSAAQSRPNYRPPVGSIDREERRTRAKVAIACRRRSRSDIGRRGSSWTAKLPPVSAAFGPKKLAVDRIR